MAPVTKHGNGAVEACAGEKPDVSVEREVADILQDDRLHAKEDRSSSRRGRRRALLIGIRYEQDEQWDTLDKTHEDVDTFRRLLLDVYGYRAEDMIVMKDDVKASSELVPTQVNIRRKLRWLVSGARSDDRFILLFAGHSTQQDARDDLEEDGQDEVMITSDGERIVDNELKKTLVDPLPPGCSLTSRRKTRTMYESITRRMAALIGKNHSASSSGSVHSRASSHVTAQTRLSIDTQVFISSALPTALEKAPSCSDGLFSLPQSPSSTADRWTSTSDNWPFMAEDPYADIEKKHTSSSKRGSVNSYLGCNGWVLDTARVAACVVPNAMREPPVAIPMLGLVRAVHRALRKHRLTFRVRRQAASMGWSEWVYDAGALPVSHYNMHKLSRALHEWTRNAKKEARQDVNGEMNVFQTPVLSSLVKLNMDDILSL
ncbi:hypothetical protein HETIRDRAFT_445962 [Heterobasidion irregulare TC 32-1]|uniref:Peptidase C14 caspase domain-containing protein n=1 Tax=Heterobasidion irregulare (strain TC 32-1) TaxID=747525 RepID=W4JX91_HETIT|nr:uncharacterized protein HETIRDRAFT_445962 [Heterobasidion irregulare TC 32-1]ETW77695.1 hypothetical protein HETIRDRAFT_445962 [Heterobasidion irregulare TC 32-1]